MDRSNLHVLIHNGAFHHLGIAQNVCHAWLASRAGFRQRGYLSRLRNLQHLMNRIFGAHLFIQLQIGLAKWTVRSLQKRNEKISRTLLQHTWQHGFYNTGKLRTALRHNHDASSSCVALFAHDLLSCIHLKLKRFLNRRMLRNYAMTSYLVTVILSASSSLGA